MPDDTSEHSHFGEPEGHIDTSRTLLGHLGVDRELSRPVMTMKNNDAEGPPSEVCSFVAQRFLINS